MSRSRIIRMRSPLKLFIFFFFNDTATTEIYTLSLHDALPIYSSRGADRAAPRMAARRPLGGVVRSAERHRSEEHTSELQSPCNLVCRLLLEKKNKKFSKRQIDSFKTISSYYSS